MLHVLKIGFYIRVIMKYLTIVLVLCSIPVISSVDEHKESSSLSLSMENVSKIALAVRSMADWRVELPLLSVGMEESVVSDHRSIELLSFRSWEHSSLWEQYRSGINSSPVQYQNDDRRSYYNLLLCKIAYVQQAIIDSCNEVSSNRFRHDEYSSLLRFFLLGLQNINCKEFGNCCEYMSDSSLGDYHAKHDLVMLEQRLAVSVEPVNRASDEWIEYTKLKAIVRYRQNVALLQAANSDDHYYLTKKSHQKLQETRLHQARGWHIVLTTLSSNAVMDKWRDAIVKNMHTCNVKSLEHANQFALLQESLAQLKRDQRLVHTREKQS